MSARANVARETTMLTAAVGPRPGDTGPVRLTASLPLTASRESRTISGAIVQYGVVGHTSWGPTIFEAGSIEPPSPLSKVKLLVQHDDQAAAVGILSQLDHAADFSTAAFSIPEGADGDDALDKAAKGLRDGLSVGCQIDRYSFDQDDNVIVHAARLYEVSLVTIPAFENAGVTSVAAAHNPNREDVRVDTIESLAADLQAGRIDQAEHDRRAAVVRANLAASNQLQPAPAVPAPVVNAGQQLERQAPAPLSAGRTQERGGAIRVLAQRTVEHLQAGHSAVSLQAALSDHVASQDTAEAVIVAQAIGELWTASRVRRPTIDAFGGPKRLTGLRVYGWRFAPPADAPDGTAGPEVRPYAGDKAAIHSNTWRTVPAEAEAQRFAGGWDFDRAYIDLGAAGYVESVYGKATDDYKLQTEAWFATLVQEAATVLPGATSVPGALSALGIRAATIGANIDTVQMAPDVWGEFVSLPESDVPWWLRSQGAINLGTVSGNAGGISFGVNPELAAGVISAGDGRAASYYEVDPPVRVTAIDLPRGGVDLGVFGYAAGIVHDPRALFSVTVA